MKIEKFCINQGRKIEKNYKCNSREIKENVCPYNPGKITIEKISLDEVRVNSGCNCFEPSKKLLDCIMIGEIYH